MEKKKYLITIIGEEENSTVKEMSASEIEIIREIFDDFEDYDYAIDELPNADTIIEYENLYEKIDNGEEYSLSALFERIVESGVPNIGATYLIGEIEEKITDYKYQKH